MFIVNGIAVNHRVDGAAGKPWVTPGAAHIANIQNLPASTRRS